VARRPRIVVVAARVGTGVVVTTDGANVVADDVAR
jgi:hypothetical protein